MKNSNIFILALLWLSCSCTDFLEIEPKTQIPSDAALSKGSNVQATLFSAYAQIASDDFLGKNIRLYSELLSDNVALNEISFNATDFTGQVALRNTNVLNKDVDNLWQNGYRAISRANAVINAVDAGLISDTTSIETQKEWKAEALFIRAIAHFELVRLFALPYSNNPGTDLGIPIRIKSLTSDEKIARNSVSDVYSQVISDLEAAIDQLPNSNNNRASKWAAKAYLTRVYFNQLDYESAFISAAEILNQFGSLTGTPITPFRNGGNINPQGGVLFQIVSGGNAFNSFRPSQQRYSINQGSSSLLQAVTSGRDTDYRNNSMIVEDGGRFYSTKWDETLINPPIIRLSEIYLIHAESAVLKNTPDLSTASNSYNAVRSFADPSYVTSTFNSASEALDAIRVERRVELLFEGDRYHELRRLKVSSFGEVKSGSTVIREAKAFNDPAWLLKIPVSETSGNSSITQN